MGLSFDYNNSRRFVDFLYAFLSEDDFRRHAPIKDLNPHPKYFSSIGILFITRGMQMENLPTSTPIFWWTDNVRVMGRGRSKKGSSPWYHLKIKRKDLHIKFGASCRDRIARSSYISKIVTKNCIDWKLGIIWTKVLNFIVKILLAYIYCHIAKCLNFMYY